MRKVYPYLQDSYYEDYNTQKGRMNFLKQIDQFVNQKQYVKITLLDWQENPIKEIAGEITSGSITKDGSSAVRVTGSLAATFSVGSYTVEDANADFSLSKKVFIEIGIKNYSRKYYTEYPILWFPQGVFFIGTFSISASASGAVNLSITLKDKMAGLNGDFGGKFSSTTILDEMDTQDENGESVSEKVLLYDLIQELVNHFGGESLNNIVIEDIDTRIRRIMKWTGDTPLYIQQQVNSDGSGDKSWLCLLEEPTDPDIAYKKYINGDDVGYIFDDFYYTSELTAAPGDSVTTILDKIKSYLGNYEYFYDVFGVFHFREIKNYLNNSQGKYVLDDMEKNDYLVETTTGKSMYSFQDDTNLISVSVSPNYSNIKNDFVVQGKRVVSGSNATYPIMYHLAIDRKPVVGQIPYKNLLIYKDPVTDLKVAAFPLDLGTEPLPVIGNDNIIYKATSSQLRNTGLFRIEKGEALANATQFLNSLLEIDRANVAKTEEKTTLFTNKASLLKAQSDLSDLGVKQNKAKIALSEADKAVGSCQGDINTAEANIKDFLAKNPSYPDDDPEHLKTYNNLQAERIKAMTALKDTQVQQLQAQVELDLINESIESTTKSVETLKTEISANEEKIKNYNAIDYLAYKNLWDKRMEENHNQLITNADKQLSERGFNRSSIYLDSITDENADRAVTIIELVESFLSAGDDKTELKVIAQETTSGYIGDNGYVYWAGSAYKFVEAIAYYGTELEDSKAYLTEDWRTELYLRGMLAKNLATDASQYSYVQKYNIISAKETVDVDFYFQELEAYWPTIYDLEKQKFLCADDEDEQRYHVTFTNGNYYLDFIDPDDSGMKDFAISSIGRRTDVVTNDDINCLFEPEIPDVIFINKDDETTIKVGNEQVNKNEQLKEEAIQKGYAYTQVGSDIYTALYTGGNHNAAFDQIKYELYTHTTYQKTVSVTAVPAWYLEPNTRVTLNDKTTNTYGDFNLQNITLTLGPSNSMSVTLNEALEKF